MLLRVKRDADWDEEGERLIELPDGRLFKRLRQQDDLAELGAVAQTSCLFYNRDLDAVAELLIPDERGDDSMDVDEGSYEYYELISQDSSKEDERIRFEPLQGFGFGEGDGSGLSSSGEDSNAEDYYTNDYPDEYGHAFTSRCASVDFDAEDYDADEFDTKGVDDAPQ